MKLSRRTFLKHAGLAWGGLLLPPPPPTEGPRQAQQLGRAILATYVYDRPTFNAKRLDIVAAETVFDLFGTVQSEDKHYNRTWYRVQQGYAHSGTVQPVQWQLNRVVTKVPTAGFLGEITVPSTLAKKTPQTNAVTLYRLYYETTYWVVEAQQDEAKQWWYKIQDDRYDNTRYWVLARHVRPIPAAELTPLSPTVTDKRIEVNLDEQKFRCFEGETLVLETLCSTGPYLRTENGARIFGTPRGDWAVDRKRPTRHMAADDEAGAGFDLPGVPWVSYFHWWGTAIHGTYWHNDYGFPRSHGCINVPSTVAKWAFRWTMPSPALTLEITGAGTPVLVRHT